MTQIVLKRAEFASALKLIHEITRQKSKIPSLKAVALTTEGTSLVLRATDLECQLTIRLNSAAPSPVHPPVRMIVGADALRQALSSMRGELLGLECLSPRELRLHDEDAGEITLTSDLLIEDFPNNQPPATKLIAKLPLQTFAETLTNAAIASGSGSNRFSISGVLVQFHDNQLEAAATDGHRLTRVVVPAVSQAPMKVIVPRLAVKLLGLSGADTKHPVTIRHEKETISFAWGDIQLVIRVAKTVFPAYDHIIPKHHTQHARVKRGDLIRAIGAIRSKGGKTPRTRLRFCRGSISVQSSVDGEGLKSEVKVPARFSGKPLEVSLDSRFLKDFLAVLPDEEVSLGISSPDSPILMTPPRHPARFQYLCMPLKG